MARTEVNDDLPTTLTDAEAWVLVGIVVIVVSIVAVFVWALLRTANYPPSTTLVLSLSMLTLVSVVAFSITASETLGAIAAAGVGALAGAVTSAFSREAAQREKEERDKAEAGTPDEP